MTGCSELAVIIGIAGKNIDAERAMAHVAAYCVANDVTARGYHRREVVHSVGYAREVTLEYHEDPDQWVTELQQPIRG